MQAHRKGASGADPGVELDAHEFAHLGEQATEAGWVGPLPPVERISAADGAAVTLSALRWGTGPVVLVLLHGAGLNAHTFDDTVLALRPVGGSVLAVDLPGHGRSSWREDRDYTPTAMLPAVTAALREWVPDRAVYAGHSLGGLLALELTARDPARVRAVALIDITPGVGMGDARQVRDFLAGPTDFASRDEIVERAAAFGFGGARRALQRGVALNTVIRPDGRVVFRHHLANLGLGEALAAAPAGAQWAALDRVVTAGLPVMLIRGESGLVSDRAVAEFADLAPGAAITTVPTGHNVQEQDPAALASALRPLL